VIELFLCPQRRDGESLRIQADVYCNQIHEGTSAMGTRETVSRSRLFGIYYDHDLKNQAVALDSAFGLQCDCLAYCPFDCQVDAPLALIWISSWSCYSLVYSSLLLLSSLSPVFLGMSMPDSRCWGCVRDPLVTLGSVRRESV
jgi:hypothetical protein